MSIEVIVYELYLEYDKHKCEGVWLIIEYEVFGHHTIMLSCF